MQELDLYSTQYGKGKTVDVIDVTFSFSSAKVLDNAINSKSHYVYSILDRKESLLVIGVIINMAVCCAILKYLATLEDIKQTS